jgi:hypothetical protein
MAADMVEIIKRHSVDPRPLFLFASLIVVHYPIEAPPELVAQYEKSQPEWCKTKQTIAAMSSIADNVTAEIVGALKEQHMWNNTVRDAVNQMPAVCLHMLALGYQYVLSNVIQSRLGPRLLLRQRRRFQVQLKLPSKVRTPEKDLSALRLLRSNCASSNRSSSNRSSSNRSSSNSNRSSSNRSSSVLEGAARDLTSKAVFVRQLS